MHKHRYKINASIDFSQETLYLSFTSCADVVTNTTTTITTYTNFTSSFFALFFSSEIYSKIT